jgi:ParB family chromosome partitioning protein
MASLHAIPYSDIHIADNRQRKQFKPEAVVELANSISSSGLIHPVVIRKDADGKLVLVAGERRLKALVYAWNFGEKVRCGGSEYEEGVVPCLYLGELDPIEAYEVELEENIRRVDLTWQEKADATRRLFELRSMQAERDDKPQPKVATIAEEIYGYSDGQPEMTVRKELIVSRHLDDPDIA